MYLYGKHSVYERLRADPGSIQRIFLEKGFHEPSIEALIQRCGVPTQRLARKRLLNIKHSDSLQGIVAKVRPFEYAGFDNLLQRASDKRYSFIFLDRIFDPRNLGAIMRVAACSGGFALVIPKHKACGVTEAALRIACGGENFTPVAQVVNLRNALLSAKESGYWVYGAMPAAGRDLAGTKLLFPLCLVLGCEGSGVRYGLQKHIDIPISIPMPGASLSFNVGAACAVFCYEIARQRP